MAEKKRICWVTATYFLDVDMPLMSNLMQTFEIDWYILTNPQNYYDDLEYLSSKGYQDYKIIVLTGKFGGLSQLKEYKAFIKEISGKNYNLYYFDITGSPFLYPLISKYISADRSIIALHNAKTPKGARLYPIAKVYTKLGIYLFKHFQTFSKNQLEYLESKKNNADIFYSPLCLKDYGGGKTDFLKHNPTNFLFFGNIVEYKRVDVLINAAEKLYEQGVCDFKVTICGYVRQDVWRNVYSPLIKHSQLFELDLRRIPSEEVARYFAKSDFFVMPYQDIAQSGAMTVALNYNIPIIASRLDTFKEFILDGQTGFFFDDHSPEKLASIMRKCIEMNQEAYSTLIKSEKEFIDKSLATDSICKRYIEYLNNLLCHD